MQARWKTWGVRPFRWTMYACVQFVVFTTIAMLLYPGGSGVDRSSRGYSFFNNFFSELGLTVTRNGTPNTPSMVLFITALTLAGLGLVLFFVGLALIFMVWVVVVAVGLFLQRKFAGLTGDSYGTINEVTQVFVLVYFCFAARLWC